MSRISGLCGGRHSFHGNPARATLVPLIWSRSHREHPTTEAQAFAHTHQADSSGLNGGVEAHAVILNRESHLLGILDDVYINPFCLAVLEGVCKGLLRDAEQAKRDVRREFRVKLFRVQVDFEMMIVRILPA